MAAPTKEQKQIKELEEQIINLKLALAKIGTLTGYGNHLKEYGIEKWTPGKKDLSKSRG